MIMSRLDNDFYQFTMSQFAWKYFHDFQVQYKFWNRNLSVPLISLNKKELTEVIEEYREIEFDNDDLLYLESTGYFCDQYLDFLDDSRLPEVKVSDDDGWLSVEYEGKWPEAIFWETPLLAMIEAKYMELFSDYQPLVVGKTLLDQKIKLLKTYPEIKFVEFGTRRRFSASWQEFVISTLVNEVSDQLIGTSNVYWARKYNLKPIGTMAHQLFMVLAAEFDDDIKFAQNVVLKYWYNLYKDHPEMLVALTDTYTTEFFLNNLDLAEASKWHSFRQDSGEPTRIADQIINEYRKKLIKLPQKIIFSDDLSLSKMLSIEKHYERSPIERVYGWGTNLTNSLGVTPLSIVIKPNKVNGKPCVKLSDTLSKATGDPDKVSEYVYFAKKRS